MHLLLGKCNGTSAIVIVFSVIEFRTNNQLHRPSSVARHRGPFSFGLELCSQGEPYRFQILGYFGVDHVLFDVGHHLLGAVAPVGST